MSQKNYATAVEAVANLAEKYVVGTEKYEPCDSNDVFFAIEGLYINPSCFRKFVRRCEHPILEALSKYDDIMDDTNRKDFIKEGVRLINWELRYVFFPDNPTPRLYVYSPDFREVFNIRKDLVKKFPSMSMIATRIHEKDEILKDYLETDGTYEFYIGSKQYAIKKELIRDFPDVAGDWIDELLLSSYHYRLQMLASLVVHGNHVELKYHDYKSKMNFKLARNHILAIDSNRNLIDVFHIKKVRGVRDFKLKDGAPNHHKIMKAMDNNYQITGVNRDKLQMRLLKEGLFVEGEKLISPVHIRYLHKASIEIGGERVSGHFLKDKDLVNWLGWYTTEPVKIEDFIDESVIREIITMNEGVVNRSKYKKCIFEIETGSHGNLNISEHAFTRFVERFEKTYSSKVMYFNKMVKALNDSCVVKRSNYIRQVVKHKFHVAKYLMHENWIFVIDEKNRVRTCYPKGGNPLDHGYVLVTTDSKSK